jgi:hypothetical protein
MPCGKSTIFAGSTATAPKNFVLISIFSTLILIVLAHMIQHRRL